MRWLDILLRQAPMDFLSALHIVSLLGVLVIVMLLVLYSSSNPKKVNDSLINSLMGIAFIFFVFKHVMVALSGTFTLEASLPLGVSDIIFIIMLIWALSHNSEYLSNIISYFGLLFLGVYSVFQVNVYPYFNIVYILDMLMVAISMASFIIFVLTNKYAPKFKYFKSSVIFMVGLGVVLFGIDFYLGSSYIYLDWFIEATPFSLLVGSFVEWGVYVITGAVLFLVSLGIALWIRRKERLVSIYTVSDIYMTNYKRRIK